jgi:hypothetical protein
MTDNVVYLAFDNPNVQPDGVHLGSCAACRNKTYKIVHDQHEYPLLQCAACGTHISRIGWVQS